MTRERWALIRRIFEEALTHPSEKQAEFLNSACGGDQELRHDVESLLSEDSSSEDFLERPQWNLSHDLPISRADAHHADSPSPPLFSQIGKYRILGVLGEGGMGTVYEAEQEHPRRIVALKVIRPGWTNTQTLRRFEQESQTLGRLQHPGIAQIYEAGTAETAAGPQSYFAMEFIRGQSLLEYAQARNLNVRQKLRLMIKICEAVDHAHQRGIIHRDLKPGNIIVDESGQPKILDFGVARVTDSETPMTRQTDMGQLVGTLAYMSPEQVLGDPLGIDTRSDVYALGVIFYELLSSQRPYKLSSKLHEAVQTIQEADPAPLHLIKKAYKGDIETIAAKALEKEKDRRYGSAAAMAADLGRYLKHEPILARPASVGYQLRKFARRHRVLVASATLLFLAIVGGGVASTWEAMRANRAGRQALAERDRAIQAEQSTSKERDRAINAEQTAMIERNKARDAEGQALQQRNKALMEERRANEETATARAVNDFLRNDILAQASASRQAGPNTKPDPDLKVRTALDRAAARISDKFGGQPLVEASIRQTLASTYEELGLYPQAEQQAERAVALRRRELGAEDRQTLASMVSLASQYIHEDKRERAESLLGEVLTIQRRVLGNQHRDTLATMGVLAIVYRREGKYAQAESVAKEALSSRRKVLGPDHPDTLESMSNLGVLYVDQGKYEPAEELLTAAVASERRLLGEEHPDTLANMGNLALVYSRQAKYAQAETVLQNVADVQRRILGEEHPSTTTTMANLGTMYVNQRKYDQAEPLYIKILEIDRRVLGEAHRDTLAAQASLATLYILQDRFSEAEPLYEKVVSLQRQSLGEQHPDTLNNMATLATLYRYESKLSEAEALATQVVDKQGRTLGGEHPSTLSSMLLLAGVYSDEAKYSQAEGILLKVVEVRRRLLGPDNPNTISALGTLGAFYRLARKYSQAEPLLNQVWETRRRTLGEEHPGTRAAIIALGSVKLEQQKFADAEHLLRQAETIYEKTAPQAWERYQVQSLLGASRLGQSKYAEAEALLVSGYQGMVQRESGIPKASKREVELAGERILDLYQAWGQAQKVSEWRETLRTRATASSPKP